MTFEEFKISSKNIDFVKGGEEQELLFHSICFLIKKDNNPKTINALQLLFDTYDIRIDIVDGIDSNNNKPIKKTAMNLLAVPLRVADALNKKAYKLALYEKNEKAKKEDDIIDLLK